MDRRSAIKGISVFGIGACICGCRTAPVTGRRQLMLMPEGQEISLGSQAYQETMSAEPVSKNNRLSEMVNRVGQRIANVAGRNDYQWEFKLISSETQNAFCLPGGKVAIYEGILPVCEDEAGLAVVMSHEIAHALARHGGERMSQNMVVDNAKIVAEKLVGTYAASKKEILMQAYGMGSKYGVLLPYSRKQESEADHIGLNLMAKAGYDPSVAPSFWTRFGSLKPGEQTPEFMSTHPADARRASDLQELMPEASSIYARTTTKHGRGDSVV
ncbi:MAG: M48 family metallopeptidase [Mariniblastus sp.]